MVNTAVTQNQSLEYLQQMSNLNSFQQTNLSNIYGLNNLGLGMNNFGGLGMLNNNLGSLAASNQLNQMLANNALFN